MTPLFLAFALFVSADDDLTPDDLAKIAVEREQARAEVAKKYGDRPSSELSQEERKAMIDDIAEAQQKVLADHGVDEKTYARQALKLDRDAYAKLKGDEKKLRDEAEKKKKDALTKKPEGPGGITVQRGVSDDKPVTLEEKDIPEGEVQVEKELPPDVSSDQADVAEQDRLEATGDEPAAKPSKAASKPSRGSRRR